VPEPRRKAQIYRTTPETNWGAVNHLTNNARANIIIAVGISNTSLERIDFGKRGGTVMNGYISVKEAAARWDLSKRQVQKLCRDGRIEGAVIFSDSWAIPEGAPKPTRTARTKPGPKPKTTPEQ
jgi:hypothetical protein